VYNPTGGPQGKGHVTFDRGLGLQYLDAGPRSLNIATNGGLSVVAVVRFTGPFADREQIVRFSDYQGNIMYLSRQLSLNNSHFFIAGGVNAYGVLEQGL